MESEEVIYHPFTKEEFENVKKIVAEVTTFIPRNYMNPIWESYRAITHTTEPTPCACKSSSRHWARAMDTLRKFVNERK